MNINKFFSKHVYIIIPLLFIIIVGAGVFYWYEIRVANIVHNCSYIKVSSPLIPEVPAVTKKDVEKSQQEYFICLRSEADKVGLRYKLDYEISNNEYFKFIDTKNMSSEDRMKQEVFRKFYLYKMGMKTGSDACGGLLKEEKPFIDAVPAKEWNREANPSEYQFCLHDKGIR